MKIRPLRAELFHADRQTDGRTDMAKLIVVFRHSANAPKNVMPDYTGWGISRLTPLYPTNGLLAAFKMAAVAPMSRISYSLTPNHYTGCHRRKGPNFGRVFLMLNYTDITQKTYIQSWTDTEIMAREKCGHLAFPRSIRLQLYREPPLLVGHLTACRAYVG